MVHTGIAYDRDEVDILHLSPGGSSTLGSKLVQWAAALGQPLLLEVEPPVDEMTRNRILFYEGLGLTLREDIDYVQPPYSPSSLES